MILTGFKFFVFLMCALMLYYVVPKKFRYIPLFLMSIFFLFFNNFTWLNLLFVVLLLLISYGGGLLINKYKDKKEDKKAKIFFILSVVLIVGIMAYLKYTNMFISIINLFMSNKIGFIDTNPPLGLSYYSLIMIGYLIDCFWGLNKAQKNPIKMGLFMTYFPIITSGPFIKYGDTEEQLFRGNDFALDRFLNGCVRALWGVFKMLVISTRIGIFVDGVYNNLSEYTGFIVIIAIIMYVFQLYANFSGSIDIVIGVSKMFGIDLPENFDRPFFAETITEFWRRWHITLGLWLKNYIFYPMMKSSLVQKLNKVCKKSNNAKVKRIPMYLCLFVLWFLIGLWHGGKLTFIIGSGLLQFLYILLEDLYGTVNVKTTPYGKGVRIFRTFCLFAIAMVFFRADSLANAMEIFGNIFKNGSFNIFSTGLTVINGAVMVVSLFALGVYEYYLDEIRSFFERTNNLMRFGFVLGLILVILLLGIYGIGFNVTDFIYSKF